MKALKLIAAVLSGISIIALITIFAKKKALITATSIAGGVFLFILFILIIVIIRSYRSSGAINGGKILKWILIVSVFVALGLIVPKYFKGGGGKKKLVKSDTASISAISEWKKKPEQYGTNPEKRRSGPMDTVITRKIGGVFNFKIYYKDRNGNNRLAKFEGEYEGDSILNGTKITGTWKQDYPADYGDWSLVSIDGDRFFEGWFTGRTGEEIPFFLKIRKE